MTLQLLRIFFTFTIIVVLIMSAGCGGSGSNVVIEHPPKPPGSYDDGPDEDE